MTNDHHAIQIKLSLMNFFNSLIQISLGDISSSMEQPLKKKTKLIYLKFNPYSKNIKDVN